MMGVVSFDAGGRTVECAFTTSAMFAYEQAHNVPFLSVAGKIGGADTSSVRIGMLLDLFGYAVKARNADFEDEQVLEIADQIGPKRLIEVVAGAINAAFPDEGDGKPDDGEVAGASGKKRKARRPKA